MSKINTNGFTIWRCKDLYNGDVFFKTGRFSELRGAILDYESMCEDDCMVVVEKKKPMSGVWERIDEG